MERKEMECCTSCGFPMAQSKWKVDFIVEKEKFITVVNYPLYVCAYCGSQTSKERANQQILRKLCEHTNSPISLSAISIEESVDSR